MIIQFSKVNLDIIPGALENSNKGKFQRCVLLTHKFSELVVKISYPDPLQIANQINCIQLFT